MPREATDSICYINGKAPCGRSVNASEEWEQEKDTGSQTQECTHTGTPGPEDRPQRPLHSNPDAGYWQSTGKPTHETRSHSKAHRVDSRYVHCGPPFLIVHTPLRDALLFLRGRPVPHGKQTVERDPKRGRAWGTPLAPGSF